MNNRNNKIMKEYYIGDKAKFEVVTGKFWPVEVIEKKQAYGHTRYVVRPLGGGDEIVTERLEPIK